MADTEIKSTVKQRSLNLDNRCHDLLKQYAAAGDFATLSEACRDLIRRYAPPAISALQGAPPTLREALQTPVAAPDDDEPAMLPLRINPEPTIVPDPRVGEFTVGKDGKSVTGKVIPADDKTNMGVEGGRKKGRRHSNTEDFSLD